MHKIFFLLFSFIFSSPALAGIYELSAVYNFKKTNYDASHYDAMEAGTASVAYYFWESMAVEISFTRGAAIQSQPEFIVYQDLTGYGASILFSVNSQNTPFKPYLKGGAAYITKILRYYYPNTPAPNPVKTEGLSPTAGLGFKYMLSSQFGIKVGLDGSQTTTRDVASNQTSTNYDFAINAGISFLF
ncbi:MAG: hypothetical protein IPM57_01660 [Oligoflexia bacterium]|nr:hypothetical protein [Oligoflexia bacterium]